MFDHDATKVSEMGMNGEMEEMECWDEALSRPGRQPVRCHCWSVCYSTVLREKLFAVRWSLRWGLCRPAL